MWCWYRCGLTKRIFLYLNRLCPLPLFKIVKLPEPIFRLNLFAWKLFGTFRKRVAGLPCGDVTIPSATKMAKFFLLVFRGRASFQVGGFNVWKLLSAFFKRIAGLAYRDALIPSATKETKLF